MAAKVLRPIMAPVVMMVCFRVVRIVMPLDECCSIVVGVRSVRQEKQYHPDDQHTPGRRCGGKQPKLTLCGQVGKTSMGSRMMPT